MKEFMKVTRSLVQMIAVTGLLVSGVCSYAQTNANGAGLNRPGGIRSVDAQMHQLTEALNLTPEQQPKVKAVLEERTKKTTEVRTDSTIPKDQLRSKMQAIQDEANHKLHAILTPEQFKKYEAWQGQRGGQHAGPPMTGASTNAHHAHPNGQ